MFKQFLNYIRSKQSMPALELKDIKCFYNYKNYPITVMRPGHPTLRLEVGEEVISKNGGYVINEWLFECSTKNVLGRKLKNELEKRVVSVETPPESSESVAKKAPVPKKTLKKK